MAIWFEGSGEIYCNIQQVKISLENFGEHFVGVVSLMPGLTKVELIEQGKGFVIIRTNEGVMKRTNISKIVEIDRLVVEFNEEYQAGTKIKTKAHFWDEFTVTEMGVKHRTVISDVEASGFLGFFYRKFGSSNIGRAFLKSYKTYFEKQKP